MKKQIVLLFGAISLILSPIRVGAQTPTPGVAVVPSFNSFKDAYEAGNQDLKDRKFSQAAAAYNAAENLASTDKGKSEAANAQGWSLLEGKRWQDAKAAFTEAVSQDADNKTAQKNLGAVSYNLYEYGIAGVDELKTAIQNLKDSGDSPELLDRAQADLTREQSYAQVTPVPESALTGESFKELLATGDQAQAQGQFDLALKAFKKAEDKAYSKEGKGAAANRAGKDLLDARRPTESIPYFVRAAADQPAEKVYLNNLGYSYWVLYDSGKGTEADLKKSVDAFYKANAIDPSYHPENMTMALGELKDVDPDAAKAYDKGEDTSDDASQTPTNDSSDSQAGN